MSENLERKTMFKIVMLVKKAENLSTQEFLERWEAHSRKVMGYQANLNFIRYAKTLPFAPSGAKDSMQRATAAFEYDAMGELWYESVETFAVGRNSAAGAAALADLKADEEGFCDMKNSVMWLGNEVALVEFGDKNE